MPIPAAKSLGDTGHTSDHNDITTILTRAKNLRDMVTPSGTDDTTAVNAALAAFDAAGGGILRIPRDNWVFTGSTGLALTGTTNPIHIIADPGTEFDMTGSTASTGVTLGGSLGSSSALTSNAARFDDTLACALSVAAGDLIRIESSVLFNVNMATSRKGEFAEVVSTTGTVITLKSPLWDSYTSATTTVTKVNTARVSVENLTVLRNSNHVGLTVQYARDVLLGGLYAEGARERLFYLNEVYGAVVDNCRGRDFWYSGTGTSYGLCVSGQHITEIGNDFRGGRHAVAHGGFIPTRDVEVIGGTFDNLHSSATASFDFHPNCENVRMSGVTMLNGLLSGASNFDADRCTVRTAATTPRTGVELSPWRSSDYIKFRNGDVQVAGADYDAVQLLTRDGSNATTTEHVEITGRLVSGTTGTAVRVAVASTSDTGATVNRLDIGGELEGRAGIVLQRSGGAAEITVKEARVKGRVVTNGTHGIIVTNTGGEQLYLDGAEIILTVATCAAYNGDTTGSMDVIIRNSRLASVGVTGDRNYFGAGRVEIQDSTIEGFGGAGGISAASASEALIANVRRISCSGSVALPARNYSLVNAAGKVTTHGTAAPAAGTWAVGDICWNTATAAAGVPGWVCTAAGTPGTWKAMANVAA